MPLPDEALLALTHLMASARMLAKDKHNPWLNDELRADLSKMMDEAATSLGPYWGVTIGQLVGQLIMSREENNADEG